ncbi:Uncharacterised protein [Burkholderia pseudomallei]|nr:Uncharacterised protein [Burkholderia pseudomallei]CAJ3428661.1 Uncharacterised protein [Burkholderia pseudomallei]CAJ3565470.1 Uncharacterised protein [Burkholderia pseudomallei]CAJ4814760.1 Uncharacterised protein [Burkholderia pseudomallei]CAJ5316593.1 Uncharacterised protein [Burkholderia pseudomallei]
MPAARGGRVIAVPPPVAAIATAIAGHAAFAAHARLVLTTRPRGTGHCLRPMRRAAASVAPSRLGWRRQCTCGRPSRARLSLASPGPRDRASRMAWRLPDAARAHHRGHMISDRRAPSPRTRPLPRGFVGTPSRVSFDARHDAPPALPCRPPTRPGPAAARGNLDGARATDDRHACVRSPRRRRACASRAPRHTAEPSLLALAVRPHVALHSPRAASILKASAPYAGHRIIRHRRRLLIRSHQVFACPAVYAFSFAAYPQPAVRNVAQRSFAWSTLCNVPR